MCLLASVGSSTSDFFGCVADESSSMCCACVRVCAGHVRRVRREDVLRAAAAERRGVRAAGGARRQGELRAAAGVDHQDHEARAVPGAGRVRPGDLLPGDHLLHRGPRRHVRRGAFLGLQLRSCCCGYRHVRCSELCCWVCFGLQEDRENILRARATGKAVLTRPFRLMSNHLGVVLTFPVYLVDLPNDTAVEDRVAATAG